MSHMEELARKGRIVELREEVKAAEAEIRSLIGGVDAATVTLLGYDRLDPDRIKGAARLLAEAVQRRKDLLAEIARLEA